jgi:hypothetical protein
MVNLLTLYEFIDHCRTELAEPGECVVDIIDAEHDAQISQRVHGGCTVIGLDGGHVKAREFEATVTIGGAHHGDLDTLAAHSGDTTGPFTFDGRAALEGKAELGEELNGGIEVLHNDTDVGHSLDCHNASLMISAQHQRRAQDRPLERHFRRLQDFDLLKL